LQFPVCSRRRENAQLNYIILFVLSTKTFFFCFVKKFLRVFFARDIVLQLFAAPPRNAILAEKNSLSASLYFFSPLYFVKVQSPFFVPIVQTTHVLNFVQMAKG